MTLIVCVDFKHISVTVLLRRKTGMAKMKQTPTVRVWCHKNLLLVHPYLTVQKNAEEEIIITIITRV